MVIGNIKQDFCINNN